MLPDLSSLCGRLSGALMRRRSLALTVFLLLLCLAGYRFHALSMDSSVASLFSDASPRLAATGKLMGFNPGARVMLVEFSAPEPGRAGEMTGAALELRRAMAPFLHVAAPLPEPDPTALLRLIPPLFDRDMEVRANALIQPEAVRERFVRLKEQLSGPLAFAPKRLWQGDPLGFLSLLTDRLPPDDMAGFSLPAGDPADGDLPVSPDGKRILLLLQPRTDMNDVYGAMAFMESLNANLRGILARHPGVEALPVGGIRFTAENAGTIERDLALTVSLSLLLIGLIYLFTVRSFGAVWLFLTPVAAVVISGAAMSFIWPVTSGLALGFGAAVLGLAEDYAVLTHFALRSNPDNKPEAIGLLARPMVFSAVLCMAGFGVLMLSSIPALRQLGFFAACSLLAGLLTAILILPCLPWMDRPRLDGGNGNAAPGARGGVSLKPRPLPTLLLTSLLGLSCFLGFTLLPFDASFQDLGANSRALQKELLALRSRWQAGPEPGVWASSGTTLDAALEASASLAANLRRSGTEKGSPEAVRVFSFSDLVPPPGIRAANLERWQSFIDREGERLSLNLRAGARDAGFTPGAFTSFPAWIVGPHSMESMEILRETGLSELLWWMTRERDGNWHVLTLSKGAPLSWQDLNEDSALLSSAALSTALNHAFTLEKRLLPLMCAICFILLAFCFRRPSLIMLACLPPLLGLAAVLTWLHLSGKTLNLAAAAALPLVMGLGADYGIVMLHELASKRSFAAFRSILVSGLTTLAGLGVLILADHPVLHALGGITFFGLCAEMAAVLLLVPLLCKPEGGATAKGSP